jgi:hypothetical protein
VRFYLDVLLRYVSGESRERPDWGEIWRTVEAVSPEEWEASKARLRESYNRVIEMVRGWNDWEREGTMGGAIAMVAHTAYHLGEIRQATCTIKNRA